MKYLGIDDLEYLEGLEYLEAPDRLGLLLLCCNLGLKLLVSLGHYRTRVEALAIRGSQALLVRFAEGSFSLFVGFVLAFQIIVGHSLTIKQYRREIAFSGVREDHYNVLAGIFVTLGNLCSGIGGGSTRDADQKALLFG